MYLSQHFTLAEAEVTQTGIANKIPKELIGNAVFAATKMERVRAILGGKPILVNSWFRNHAVNKKVGGVPNSDHLEAVAIDFRCPSYGTPKEIAKLLAQKVGELNFDQLIFEQTWVHISFRNDRTPRNQVLTMQGGKYSVGIN